MSRHHAQSVISLDEFRDLTSGRLSLSEVRTLWFHVFGTRLDDDFPARNLDESLRELHTRARERNLLAKLLEELAKERSDIVNGLSAPAPLECPYRGLEIFDEAHTKWFFGRDALRRTLLEKLQTQRVLVALGASGSGKSSLLRAGLLVDLKNGKLPGSEKWSFAVFRPGAAPLEELALRLAGARGAHDLRTRFEAHDDALHLHIREKLLNDPPGTRFCILIDQLEELLTFALPSEAERLIANLHYALEAKENRLTLLAAMRADFLGKAIEIPRLKSLLDDHAVFVASLIPEELREAVEKPAQSVGAEFEPGLSEQILRDAGTEPGTLPLTQHALHLLFEKRDGRRLTFSAYNRLGGVKGALTQYADEIYEKLSPEERAEAQRILLRLIRPGDGTEDTRRRAPFAELTHAERDEASIRDFARKLGRLVTTDGDSGGAHIEIAHEALIRQWERLRGWIEKDRDGLRIHAALAAAAAEWRKNGHDASYLYNGARLAQAAEWRDKRKPTLSEIERRFLEAGRNAEQSELETQKRSARRLRFLAATLSVLLAIAGAASWFAYQKQREAFIGQANLYQEQGRERLLADEPISAALYLNAAYQQRTERKLGDDPALRFLLAQAMRPIDAQLLSLEDHTNAVTSAVFSPDGARTRGRARNCLTWQDIPLLRPQRSFRPTARASSRPVPTKRPKSGTRGRARNWLTWRDIPLL